LLISASISVCSSLVHSQASQLIQIHLSKNDQPISGTLQFIVDPVDSAVLAVGFTDNDGFCSLKLCRPLKSINFQLKIFGMGYHNGFFNLDTRHGEKIFFLPWNYETTHLATFYANKNGIRLDHVNPQLVSVPNIYYKQYCDTAVHYTTISINDWLRYEQEMIEYKNELVWLDSVIKTNRGLDYLYPRVPDPPEWRVEEEICTYTTRSYSFAGGDAFFYDNFKQNKKFQILLRAQKKLRVYFRLSEDKRPYITEVVICGSNLKRIKGLDKFCEELVSKKIEFDPVELNGRSVRISKEMLFYVDFIYQPD